MRDRTVAARLVGLAVLLAMVVAACGQKPGVFVAGAGQDVLTTGTGTAGTAGTGAAGTAGTGAAGTAGTGAAGTAGTGTAGTAGTGTAGTTGTTGPAPAGDRTGIFPDRIVIGLHAPLTGAAPIEPRAFSIGKDLYWNWIKSKGQKVFGRNVEVVFRDDTYKPSTAVAVCNQMATSDKAFLLIGGAGADQIQACANYAEPRSIPYLSPGVQKNGLNTKRGYFAVTMTYADQMPLLIQLLKKENAKTSLNKYGNEQVLIGHVRPNTPNFTDADQALRAAATSAGFGYRVYTVVKEGSQGEANSVATQMQQAGVDVVVPITAPLFTTQLAARTGANQYKPLYAGVAISNNVNQMINNVCRNNEFENALWLSPWPGWKQVMAGQYDAEFRQAAAKFADDVNKRDKGGDILMALWGIMKAVHQAMLKAGPDMTRQSFIESMRSFNMKTGMFPDLRFDGSSPFGARNVHTLLGKCDEQGDGGKVSRGPQWIEHPGYAGLRSSF